MGLTTPQNLFVADGIVSLKEFATSLLPETLPAVVRATYSFYDKMDGVSDGVLRYSLMDTAFTYHDVNRELYFLHQVFRHKSKLL